MVKHLAFGDFFETASSRQAFLEHFLPGLGVDFGGREVFDGSIASFCGAFEVCILGADFGREVAAGEVFGLGRKKGRNFFESKLVFWQIDGNNAIGGVIYGRRLRRESMSMCAKRGLFAGGTDVREGGAASLPGLRKREMGSRKVKS